MLDRARESPQLTAMVVPSPYGLTGDVFLQTLIREDYLGSLRELHVHGLTSDLADPQTPMSWRQMTRYSGFNMLTLGILYETVLRWVAPANRVFAYASKVIPRRLDPEQGKPARVGTPDSVQVLTTQSDGSCGVYRLSGVVHHDRSMGIALYGSKGTILYDLLNDQIRGARSRDSGLQELSIPETLRGNWQVEADFIASIRGERAVSRTDFETGVKYMQFTEAVARSSRHQVPVTLPLREFSNPSL
jgi:predicted dehydrogenase